MHLSQITLDVIYNCVLVNLVDNFKFFNYFFQVKQFGATLVHLCKRVPELFRARPIYEVRNSISYERSTIFQNKGEER